MALERKWNAVPPQSFTANGSAQGLVTVLDTAGFKTKQVAYLKNNTIPNPLAVQVKRVLSPTQLIVGAIDNKIAQYISLDISAYTVVSGASIGAEEQNKNNVPSDDHYSAIYESDPTIADRVVPVDQYGNIISQNNPLPTQPVGSASDKDWDDLLIGRDPVTQDITTATYKKNGNTVRTLTLTYDANENLQEVKKS